MMDNATVVTVDENAPMLGSRLPDKESSSYKSNKPTSKKPHSAKKSRTRTPLASRNINTPSSAHAPDRGHIARTNSQGDIVIYSPAFILKKDGVGLGGGGTGVIIEDVDAEQDLSVSELNFEQFRKRNLSFVGAQQTPGLKPVDEGRVAPNNSPADEADQTSPPQAGQGELLMAKNLLYSTNTPTAIFSSKQMMSDTRGALSTTSSTGISPVHFSSQGLTPLMGTPKEKLEAEMAKRMEELEDRFAKQELEHQKERATFQSMIEKLTSQVEMLNSRLSDS